MKRDEWVFSYTADKVFAAAQEKKDFHSERLAWWDKKRTEVEGLIRSEGIEIDESAAGSRYGSGDNNVNTWLRGAQVTIRTDLVRDLQECVDKTRGHREKIKEYDAWIQVLASQGSARTLSLGHDDWIFFFGR